MNKNRAILLTSLALAGGIAIALHFIDKNERKKRMSIHFM